MACSDFLTSDTNCHIENFLLHCT
uniref:Uncharacterized protein n=1 Tax=Ciona intestinalis TaxID=7719 RepID=H2Y287_CIOIN